MTVDGQVEPYLAESVTPNDDYTVWTIKVRSGVSFHDGTPFDGAVIATTSIARQVVPHREGPHRRREEPGWHRCRSSSTDDPTSAQITMSAAVGAVPALPVRAIGYMASPTWHDAADADPALESKPVGTGPFIFKNYKPGESFDATKNPSYWNQPYPYLDEVEFRVIPDGLTRSAALEAGDVDLIHTDERRDHREVPRRARELPDDRDHGVRRDRLHAPQRHAAGSPLHGPARALRDGQRNRQPGDHRQARAGVDQIANGPFSPTQLGTCPRPASRRSKTWPRRRSSSRLQGRPPGSAEHQPVDDPGRDEPVIAQAQQQFFTEAGFDDVQISQIEQAKYILTALQGDFQAFQWRNHGGLDLDAQYIWWSSENALPRRVSSR